MGFPDSILARVLSVMATLAILYSGASWVWAAESEHKDGAEIRRDLTEIIKSHDEWIKKEEAVRRENERIRKCLKTATDPETCLR